VLLPTTHTLLTPIRGFPTLLLLATKPVSLLDTNPDSDLPDADVPEVEHKVVVEVKPERDPLKPVSVLDEEVEP
jgi:hypothetical protein